MKIIVLFLFYTAVKSLPVKQSNEVEINVTGNKNNENDADSDDRSVTENEVNGEPRAGIIDNINPFNKNPTKQPETIKNKDNGQNNNPLGAIQNVFSTVPNLFNGSNIFQQLFASQSGGNFLDNIKVFLVGAQGMVMPASAMLGGLQNLMQTLGNMGNLIQVPSLPSGS